MDYIGPRVPRFGKEPRNLRLGFSPDGVNPFNGQSNTHSIWPVWVCMYNLPPWKCMKKKYITMCMLVQGPKQPGIDLNLYLRPADERGATNVMERRSQYVGRRRTRIFPNESHGDHDGARLSRIRIFLRAGGPRILCLH